MYFLKKTINKFCVNDSRTVSIKNVEHDFFFFNWLTSFKIYKIILYNNVIM